MNRHHLRVLQQGLTIVELMIAIALGLAVVLAGLSLYIQATINAGHSRDEAYNVADNSSAFAEMGRQIKMAGYGTTRFFSAGTALASRSQEGPGVVGCDGGFVDARFAGDPSCAGGAGADGLAVTFEADAFNGRQVGATVLDCAGAGVAISPMPAGTYAVNGGVEPVGRYLTQNRYFLNGATSQLVCSGSGGAVPYSGSAVLLENVEEFQLQYSSLLPGSGEMLSKVTATELVGRYPSAPEAWSSVQAVHLCVIAVGAEANASRPVPYQRCDGSIATAADNRIRRRFDSSMSLRNQVPSGL